MILQDRRTNAKGANSALSIQPFEVRGTKDEFVTFSISRV